MSLLQTLPLSMTSPQSADGSQEDGGGAGLRENKAVQCGGGRGWRCGQCDHSPDEGEGRSFEGGDGGGFGEVGGALQGDGCGFGKVSFARGWVWFWKGERWSHV